MSGRIKYITVVGGILALLETGCTHYAAFPELEEGVISDEQNAAYDDSIQNEGKKPVKKVKVVEANIQKDQKKTEKTDIKKAEKSKAKETIVEKKAEKDLTVPNPVVSDIAEDEVKYVVPSKTTPVVITDIDLKEMDAEDNKTKVIKPISETKTILPVKKEQKVIKGKVAVPTEPSVFYLAETVYFNNGGSSVDNSYYKKLRQIVKEAKAHNGKIIVQGFASSRTKNTDIITHKMANLKVSVARAENIAKILAQYGMPKNRIITEGLSDSRPAYQEVMPEGERLNRRAEIYISY